MKRWHLTPLLLLIACGSGDGQALSVEPTSPTSAVITGAAGSARCVAPLVRLRTGSDAACGGGNEHRWPVGMPAAACHGWRAIDTGGREHDDSANNIRCNSDGSFSFTQFAGNLNCAGSGVTKTYRLNACEQDTPPTLYTVALDLACCTSPNSAACMTGTPSISVPGGAVYLDGSACLD